MQLAGLIGSAASLSSCSLYFSDLQFVNGTDSPAVNLVISDGTKTWKLGDLEAGAHVNFSGHLSGEGGPSISWTWNGKRFSSLGCYYTEGAPAKGKITVAGDKLLYRCQ
jgi:hypothetical protein